MDRRPTRLRIQRDDGFSIIESMVALAFLAVVFTIAAGVLASSLGALSRARVEAMASNLGQALIEEVRLVPYRDVGTLTGSPQGVFPDSIERTIDNRTFDVEYRITFEGSATGLDIIDPGSGSPSGDGTGSAFDSGIDYKRVQVTITDRNNRLLSPTVFDTLVSPPDIAANEGLANVRVNVVKVDVLSEDTTPLPQVCIASGANQYTMTPNALGEAVFIGITPNGNNSSLPDYWYTARIGSACGTSDPLSGWMMEPAIVDTSDRTNVAPTATGNIHLTLTRPQSVDVSVVNGAGSQLPSTLELTVGSDVYSFDNPTGNVTIDQLAGAAPLLPGTYNLRVRSTGYVTEDVELVVPTAGGVEVVMSEGVEYTLQVTYPGMLNRPVVGAAVTLSGPDFEITEFTDGQGRIATGLPATAANVSLTIVASGMNTYSVTAQQSALPNSRTLSGNNVWYFYAQDVGNKGNREFQILYRNNVLEPVVISAGSVDSDGHFVIPVLNGSGGSGHRVRLQTRCGVEASWSNVNGTSWRYTSVGSWYTQPTGEFGSC